jgi:carnitine monooxygenase subunit
VSRDRLVEMAKRNIAHAGANTVDLEPGIFRVPASNYIDPVRWQLEMDRIFQRLPLMLAFSAEVRNPGDYKAMDVAGTPVLISRGTDGAVRAFVNMCSHRGSIVMREGLGNARRFSCPYHAWSYDQHGDLVGILDREAFGDVDVSVLGLTPLPVAERSGLIFASLTPGATMDIDTFLAGYGEMLDHLGFDQCRVVGSQSVAGPNWKIAYDGYLDFYHLPILHRDSFGPNYANKASYDSWGPHQRVSSPARSTTEMLGELPEDEWTAERLTGGVWTIFPHISVASFDAGGRVFMVSQLFPGATVGESITVQTFLHTQAEAPGQAEQVAKTMAFLHHVVQDEDYYTGLRLQSALRTGAKQELLFGRNEGGGHRFHRWVDALIAADNDALTTLLRNGISATTPV